MGRHIGKLMWLAPDCRSRSIGTANWNKKLEPRKGKVKSSLFQTLQLRAQKTNSICLFNLCLNFGIEVITEEHQCFRSFFRCQRLFNLCSVNNTLSPEMKSFILISNFPICPSFTVSEQEINKESNKISVNYIFKNKL